MNAKTFVLKRPLLSYFTLTFFISWTGAFALVAKKWIHGESIPKFDGILLFPIMLLGPSLSALFLKRLTSGKKGLKDLLSKITRHIPVHWFCALLIPPAAILLVLNILSVTVSREYHPNFFPLGFLFGIPAGLLEEIGWMGFAFPVMVRRRTALSSAILLGLVWGLWHLPVINFLGTASPHGAHWLLYFIAFTAVMTAMRVIISWVYCSTKSLWLCQLMHISSTGSLVMLSPSPMTTQDEPLWYFGYAIALWFFVLFLRVRFGRSLDRRWG